MADGAPLAFHKETVMPAVPEADAIYFIRPAPNGPMSIVVTSSDGTPASLIADAPAYREVFPAAAQWIVNHNLGRTPAAIAVLSSGGVEVDAFIVHTSDNQFVVDLNPPMAGQVIVQ